jgi:hypothetical protein
MIANQHIDFYFRRVSNDPAALQRAQSILLDALKNDGEFSVRDSAGVRLPREGITPVGVFPAHVAYRFNNFDGVPRAPLTVYLPWGRIELKDWREDQKTKRSGTNR